MLSTVSPPQVDIMSVASVHIFCCNESSYCCRTTAEETRILEEYVVYENRSETTSRELSAEETEILEEYRKIMESRHLVSSTACLLEICFYCFQILSEISEGFIKT